LLGARGTQAQKNTHIAVKYLKRFLTHPFFEVEMLQMRNSEHNYLRKLEKQLHAIDSIEHGSATFTTRFITSWPDVGRDRQDPFYEFHPVVLNALDVCSNLLSLAIQLQDPFSLAWIVAKINDYKDFSTQECKVSLLLDRLLRYPLNNAFEKKDTQAINFLLKAMKAAAVQPAHFSDLFGSPGLIHALTRYVLEESDTRVLAQIKELITDQVFKKILNKFLNSSLSQNALTQELMEKLLAMGMDINAADHNESPALINAIVNANPAMLRIILRVPNINVNIREGGYNALWWANNAVMDWSVRQEIIELLQHAGASEEGACAIQ
jgi:hypothetical protein